MPRKVTGKRFSNVDLVVKFTKIGISLTYQELTLHCVYMYRCVCVWKTERAERKSALQLIFSRRKTAT